MPAISTEELFGLNAEKKTKKTITSEQLFEVDPILGYKVGSKEPASQRLSSVLKGVSQIDDFIPQSSRTSFKFIADAQDKPEEYRERVLASMLLSDDISVDYNAVDYGFDSIVKQRFKKKLTPAQVIAELSPYPYESPNKKVGFGERFVDIATDPGELLRKAPFSTFSANEQAMVIAAAKRHKNNDYETVGKLKKLHAEQKQLEEEGYKPNYADEKRYSQEMHPNDTADWVGDDEFSMQGFADQALDEKILVDYYRRQEELGRLSTGGQIAEGALAMPAFMIEFAMTGGVAKIGNATAQKATQKLMKNMANKAVKKGIRKVSGAAVGAFVRSGNLTHMVADRTLSHLTPEIEITQTGKMDILTNENSIATAVLKGYGDVFIESLSEVSGPAISKGLNKIPFADKLQRAIGDAWMKKTGGTWGGFYTAMVKKGGYDGFIEELGEERVGSLLRAITGIEGDGNIIDRVVQSIPDGEDLLVEAGVLAIPQAFGLAVSVPGQVAAKRKSIKQLDKTISNIKNSTLQDEAKESLIAKFDEKKSDILSGKYSQRSGVAAVKFRSEVKTKFNLDDKEASATMSIIEAVASKQGLTAGEYVETYISGIEDGKNAQTQEMSIEEEAKEVFGQEKIDIDGDINNNDSLDKNEVARDNISQPEYSLEREVEKKQDSDNIPVYVRYGALPPNGISTDFRNGEQEKGTSVFHGILTKNGKIKVTPNTNDTLGSFLMGGVRQRPVYVALGDKVGIGADGEPVLNNVELLSPEEAVEHYKTSFNQSGDHIYKTQAVKKVILGRYDGIENLDNEDLVSEDLFVHGRHGGNDLSSDGLILLTQDMQTAIDYSDYESERSGSIHLFKKPDPSRVLDISDSYSDEMQTIIDLAIQEQMFTDYISRYDDDNQLIDIENLSQAEINDEIEEITRTAFSPDNIVDSARGFDNPDFFGWFYERFGDKYDFVIPEDGAIVLNPKSVESAPITLTDENGKQRSIVEEDVKKAINSFNESAGRDSSSNPDILAQEVADENGNPNLDGIWYQNKLKSEIKKKIIANPQYQVMLEPIKQRAEMFLSHISQLDFGGNLGDVKDYIDGSAASTKGYLWKYVSAEAGKGQSWDSAALEVGEILGEDPITDPLEMITTLDEMVMAQKENSGVNEKALEMASSNYSPDLEILTKQLELLEEDISIDLINKETARIAKDYGMDDSQAGEFALERKGTWSRKIKVAKKQKEIKKRKAQVEFAADGKAVIRAFESADFSSVVHELGHIFRRTLDATTLAEVEDWAGASDRGWDEAAEEKFARGFEKYIWDGKSPSDSMAGVFSQMKEWMRKIYTSVKNSPIDVEITPKVRRVFDNLLALHEVHPGEMSFDQFAGKYAFELGNPTSEWFDLYQMPAGVGLKKLHKQLRDDYKVQKSEAKIAGLREEVRAAKVSDLKKEQQDQVRAMTSSEFKPNAGEIAKMMNIPIEELLSKEGNFDRWAELTKRLLVIAIQKGDANGQSKQKKKYRQSREYARAAKVVREQLLKIADEIARPVPMTVHAVYRQAISILQEGFDPSLRSNKTLAKKENLLAFMENNPDVEIPGSLVKWATKKSINQLTTTELKELRDEINKLKKQGRKRKQLEVENEKQKRFDLVDEMVSKIAAQDKTKPNVLKMENVKPKDIQIKMVESDDPDFEVYQIYYKERLWEKDDLDGDKTIPDLRRFRKGTSESDIKETLKDTFAIDYKEPVVKSNMPPLKVYRSGVAETMSLARMCDLMDGGKGEFGGLFHRNFYDAVKLERAAAEVDKSHRSMALVEKIEELGFTVKQLTATISFAGGRYQVQEILGMYINSFNHENYQATAYGSGVPHQVIHEAVVHCEEAVPNLGKLGEWMLAAYDNDENFTRVNAAFIRMQEMGAFDEADLVQIQEMRAAAGLPVDQVVGMVKVKNYSPIIRMQTDKQPHEKQMLYDTTVRSGVKKGYVNKGFTNNRQRLAKEHQQPIRLDAVNIFLEHVAKEEHFVHLNTLTAQHHSILGNSDLKDAIIKNYGKSWYKAMVKYVSDIAAPGNFFDNGPLSKMVRTLKNNWTVGILSGNLSVISKQGPSLMLYGHEAGQLQMLKSFGSFMAEPLRFFAKTRTLIEKTRELDPLITNSEYNDIMNSIRAAENFDWSAWSRRVRNDKGAIAAAGVRTLQVLNTIDYIPRWISKKAMTPIGWMDTMVKTIGWNAVYNKAKAEGASDAEALRRARNVTARTQPVSDVEDTPQFLRHSGGGGEFTRLMMVFRRQLNQIWGMSAYDTAAYIKGGHYNKAFQGMLGLGMASLFIWIITNKRMPEDEKEMLSVALAPLEAVPVIGSEVQGIESGFGNGVPIVGDVAQMYVAGKNIVTGDGDVGKNAMRIAENAMRLRGNAVGTGKKIYRTIERGDAMELVGGKSRK